MTAGPWRLDALEILRVARMARFDRRHLVEVIRDDRRVGPGRGRRRRRRAATDDADARRVDAAAPRTRAKLRRLLGALEELNPLTWREGPFTILERFLERTGQVLDLIAAGTLEAKRTRRQHRELPALRGATGRRANPNGTLAGFVAYLDAYQRRRRRAADERRADRGRRGRPADDPVPGQGPRVPDRLRPEPARRASGRRASTAAACFPRELLREAVPAGDIHTDEERRLLYVAMTRAQDRLILTTHGGPTVQKGPSLFVGELLDGAGAGAPRRSTGRPSGDRGGGADRPTTDADDDDADAIDRTAEPTDALDRTAALVRRVMPLPTTRERRLALRLRASELVGLMEGDRRRRPRGRRRPRRASPPTSRRSADRPRWTADEARALGLDPLTFRSVALDSGAGANLLQVAPLPRDVQLLVARHLRALPAPVRVRLRLPDPDRAGPSPRSPSGRPPTRRSRRSPASAASALRARRAAADPRGPRARCSASAGPRPASATRRPRRATSGASQTLLDNFWDGEVQRPRPRRSTRSSTSSSPSTRPTARPPVIISGSIDRIDRLPSGGIEVIDYKTGRVSSPEGRRREPPAVDLRAGLPRRAGPRHAGAGDAVLHRVGDAAEHDAHGRAAGRGAGRTSWRGWRGSGRASSRRRRRRTRAGGATTRRCARAAL